MYLFTCVKKYKKDKPETKENNYLGWQEKKK